MKLFYKILRKIGGLFYQIGDFLAGHSCDSKTITAPKEKGAVLGNNDNLADSGVGTHNKITRERWLESVLNKILPGSRILDAGAGELRYKKFCSHLDYVSQDFAQYDGQGDTRGLQSDSWDNSKLDIISDIISIPRPDASFDAIMCIEVFEHIPAPVDALREFVRLLKSGGSLILTAPFCSLTHMSPYFYQTGYSRYFYEYWFQKLGMSIVEIQFNGNYFEYLAQEIRRLPAMAQKYAGMNYSPQNQSSMRDLLAALGSFSSADKGSDQLLCFGLHIFAQRVKQSDRNK